MKTTRLKPLQQMSAAGRYENIFIFHDVETGRNARRARNNAGLSVRQVAMRMGISAAYLSDLELGRRKWREALVTKLNNALAGNLIGESEEDN